MKSLPLSIRLHLEWTDDFVATRQWQLAAIDEGLDAAEAGRVARHEDVLEWVRSWGQPDELPPPPPAGSDPISGRR